MACSTIFTCNHCAFRVEAWDEGNPYLTDNDGKRHFFYHPGDDHEQRVFMQQQTTDFSRVNELAAEIMAIRDEDEDFADYRNVDLNQLIELIQKSMTDRHGIDEAEFVTFRNSRSGNEAGYLCMHCAHETRRDPDHDSMNCPSCQKLELWDTWKLEGRRCPKCGQGTFAGEFGAIS